MSDSVESTDRAEVVDGDEGTVMNAVLSELRSLRRDFAAKIRYDEVQERRVQAMSEELSQYKNDFMYSLVRPLLMDLISMYDDLTKVMDSPSAAPGTTENLLFFREGVEQILARNGVWAYVVDGDVIDRRRQQVLGAVGTEEAGLDGTVAARLRAGFAMGERVLRPEWVNVHRFRPPAVEPEGPADAPVEAIDLTEKDDELMPSPVSSPDLEATIDLRPSEAVVGESQDPAEPATQSDQGVSS